MSSAPPEIEDTAEAEQLRQSNKVISLCLLFLITSAAPSVYASLRPLFSTPGPSNATGTPPQIALPELPSAIAIAIKIVAFAFFSLALRITLIERPSGAKALLIITAAIYIGIAIIKAWLLSPS